MQKLNLVLVFSILLAGITLIAALGCKKENTTEGDTGTVKDYDGNVYHTITIGKQTWLVENLKTTHYSDGREIPLIIFAKKGPLPTIAGYCWYNNDQNNSTTHGALYNWYAVDTKKLCPKGWHVPTAAEWDTLTTFLGGEYLAGGKLKEKGTLHWAAPNTGADNSSGFTAIPGGYREDGGNFYNLTGEAHWWTSSAELDYYAHSRFVNYNYPYLNGSNGSKSYCFSVRCIGDDIR